MNCAIFSAASKSVTSCVRLKLWMCVSSRALYTSCHTSCVNIDRTHSKAQARLRHRCAAFPSFLCFSLQHDCGGGQRGALDPFYSRHDRVYDRQINVNLVVATSHLKVCFAAQIYPWTIFFFSFFLLFSPCNSFQILLFAWHLHEKKKTNEMHCALMCALVITNLLNVNNIRANMRCMHTRGECKSAYRIDEYGNEKRSRKEKTCNQFGFWKKAKELRKKSELGSRMGL